MLITKSSKKTLGRMGHVFHLTERPSTRMATGGSRSFDFLLPVAQTHHPILERLNILQISLGGGASAFLPLDGS
jgi:hypothetical protein